MYRDTYKLIYIIQVQKHTVKPAHAVTSIKLSHVLKGHLCLVLPEKMKYMSFFQIISIIFKGRKDAK
jgi:hypothetical protein